MWWQNWDNPTWAGLYKECKSRQRQVAVRHVLKALQSLEASEQLEDVEQVFALVRDRFAEDSDPLIRAELVEQLPMLCMNCQQTPGLQHKIDTVLIPLLAKFLDDLNTQSNWMGFPEDDALPVCGRTPYGRERRRTRRVGRSDCSRD
uniref:Uncharacterized protein n=1 Tax=Plectus sambesii TaxID=2011161 RepID=A0A914V2M0_9BILA